MSLNPHVFKAIAGAGKIPAVGSLVYYFPQGHVEQSSPSANLSSISVTKPFALCKVSAVNLLASAETDEVFIKIQLDPTDCSFGGDSIGYEFGKDVVSFAKILTPSDANNGGGFSVPRFCADSIFPKLDFTADPPLQTLMVTDVHGKIWEFRHIYRGTPRRHLLTTGWSKFVNSKKLVAGDSIVFVKDSEEKLFVGVRRTARFCGNLDGLRLDENGFSRNAKGRVLGELVAETIRAMEMGRRFEVVYYPRAGMSEFVVEKEVVDRVRGVYWVEGMRVKMAVETDDASRMTWFQGTVRRSEVKDSGPWANSPWRMLQVTWDEPEVLQNVRAISPWQVEIVSPSPRMQVTFPAIKKAKVQEGHEFPSEGRGNIFFPQSDTNNMKMGNFTSLLNYPTSPAGMQGARQNFFVPSFFNFVQWNTHFTDKVYGINGPEGLNTSELDTASPPSQETMHTSQLEAASPPSQKSIQNDNLELLGIAACNPTRKVSKGSIQLFGQIIHTDQPNGDSADREKAQNKGIRALEFSLSFPRLGTDCWQEDRCLSLVVWILLLIYGMIALVVRRASHLFSMESSVDNLNKRRKATIAVTVSLVLGSLLFFCIIYFMWRKKRTIREENWNEDEDLELPLYDLDTIIAATDNFSTENKLGEGGFGPVYKGKLPGGQEIAVKRLSKTSNQGVVEFKNEVLLIAKLQHRNLVRLLGYCTRGEDRMLIYEYMPNKSLDAFLFDKAESINLGWGMRFNIIIGIARGLLYLHQDSRFRIIHRDLKASNVLLDEEMNPKISDFGLARIYGTEEATARTRRVVGTYGYMSPEYAMDGIFSVKSDVFSFGVLVLEIVSGQRTKAVFLSEPEDNLLRKAWGLWSEDRGLELIDPAIGSDYSIDEVIRCIKIGLLCVQENPKARPKMSSVVHMLSDQEGASILEPQQPGFTARSDLSFPNSSSTNQGLPSINDITFSLDVGR